jgi:hypothetical protein
MVWILLCFIFCFTAFFRSAVSDVPPSVRIGGLFAPISSSDKVFRDEAEHLAAFVMAARDINNKTDGIYDDLLPGTTFEIAVGFENSLPTAATSAVSLATKSFGGQGVDAVVISLLNTNALLVTQMLDVMNLMTVLSVAFSGAFAEESLYPWAVNIRPLISRHGMAIQNVVCLSTARKIVVFAGTDEDSLQIMSQFQDESICKLDILAVIGIRSELNDMSYEIAQGLRTGARYFVNFLQADQNAWLIEQGYEAGLFHDNTVIYTTSNGVVNITSYFSPTTDVAHVLTGLLYTKYVPNYYLKTAPEAINFARRWSMQPSRAGEVVNGIHTCDQTKDDSGNYLYQVAMNNKTTICTGLNFSLYSSEGSNLLQYTPLTYDATIMLAMAMDLAIRTGLDYKDPYTLLSLMVTNISFDGATGPVNLFPGYAEYGYSGRGMRNAGTQYYLNNFNPSLYSSGSTNYMVHTGTFDGDSRVFTPCAPVDSISCFLPVYSAETDGSYNNPPADSPPVIVMTISSAFSALCLTMAAIVVFLVAAFGLFTMCHRRSRVIKASQPVLLICILLGGVIASLRIGAGGLAKNDSVCAAEVWFGHLAFAIMIGSLFVKSYRVHCIVNTRTLVRVMFSTMRAFRLLLGIVVAMVVGLAVTHAVGKPHMRTQSTTAANQQTDIYYCSLKYPQFQTALFVMEGLMLAVSFRVCWEIRNVPDVVNESKQISTAMSAIVLVSVLILPIVYFLGLSQFTQELVASFGFGFGAIVTLTLLFVPKIMIQYRLNSSRLSAKVAMEAILTSDKKYHKVNGGAGNDDATTDATVLDLEAEALLKGKSKEEKLIICTEQQRRWQLLLLSQQRAALNSHSTSSNACGSSDGAIPSGQVRIEPSIMSSVMQADDADLANLTGQLHGVTCISAARSDVSTITAENFTSGSRQKTLNDMTIQDI